jgi:ABC-type antimicrobial peptide transport system permease subunit
MHTDFVIYQFVSNIIRIGLFNITLNAEIEYKRNIDLFYSLNAYQKPVMYQFVNIIKTLTSRSG